MGHLVNYVHPQHIMEMGMLTVKSKYIGLGCFQIQGF